MERIAIDFTGPLPETTSYNRYIMVVSDYFTKFTEAYALPNITARTAAGVLVREFICRWGAPRQIHTDQGAQFESQLFQEVCALLGIEKTRTSAFRPQSDGQVERMNRTLKDMLYHYLSDKQDDWDLHLPFVLMAYRATPHGSTQLTPNLLMLGREVECPEDLVYRPPLGGQLGVGEYAQELRDRIADAHQVARDHLRKAAIHQKQNYDHRAVDPPNYQQGDTVLLVQETARKGLSTKLSSHWDGPYLVIQRIGPVNVRIRKGPRHKSKVVHVDRLKPFQGDYDPTWWTEKLETGRTPSNPQDNQTMGDPAIKRPVRRRRAPRKLGEWST